MARSIQVLLTLTILSVPSPGHRDADAQRLSRSDGNRTNSQTESLGNGFFNHGVVTPLSIHRGVVAAVDGRIFFATGPQVYSYQLPRP